MQKQETKIEEEQRKKNNMKKSITALVSAAVLALTALSANANSIVIGPVSTAPDGSGGTLWTYPIVFINSHISASQPTSFNLNDFGALKTTGPLPTGFSFSPGVAFTLDNSLFVGPNFGLPGFQPNDPTVLDVVVTFTADADMALPVATFNLVLDTALNGTAGNLANFFSQDIVQAGPLAGTPNAVQQNIDVPSQVPDGGTTVALLGIALAGLEGVRRMFRARKS